MRKIRITDELRAECLKEFSEMLTRTKVMGGEIKFSKTFYCKGNQRVSLVFTEEAWLKMDTLVKNFSSEVAWHGVVNKSKNGSGISYTVLDIIVFPQNVSGVTVETDQEAYEKWLYSEELNDVFDGIRMQGHSHVNMSVSPSGTDLEHQRKILGELEDDMFYIFLIQNKRGEQFIRIYDMEENAIFEAEDIDVEVLDGEYGLRGFLDRAKGLVTQCSRQVATAKVAKGAKSQKRSEALHREAEDFYATNSWSDYYQYEYGDFAHCRHGR